MNKHEEEDDIQKGIKELLLMTGVAEEEWRKVLAVVQVARKSGTTFVDTLPLIYALSLKKAVREFDHRAYVTSKAMIFLTVLLFLFTIAQIFIKHF